MSPSFVRHWLIRPTAAFIGKTETQKLGIYRKFDLDGFTPQERKPSEWEGLRTRSPITSGRFCWAYRVTYKSLADADFHKSTLDSSDFFTWFAIETRDSAAPVGLPGGGDPIAPGDDAAPFGGSDHTKGAVVAFGGSDHTKSDDASDQRDDLGDTVGGNNTADEEART